MAGSPRRVLVWGLFQAGEGPVAPGALLLAII